MKELLNQVDLCFVIDTTGSMGGFLQSARDALVETLTALSEKQNLDLRVALVEYRDHPPQERSFVARKYPMTSDLRQIQRAIADLKADGGGDRPEAVFDGVRAAVEKSAWREFSSRFVLLVGDAPPHGYPLNFAPENRKNGESAFFSDAACTCGLKISDVTAAAEANRVVVCALPIAKDAVTLAAFTEIARGTGGICADYADSSASIKRISELLDAEFANLAFDAAVLDAFCDFGEVDVENISEKLGESRAKTAASLARLGRRGFLDREKLAEIKNNTVIVETEPNQVVSKEENKPSWLGRIFGDSK